MYHAAASALYSGETGEDQSGMHNDLNFATRIITYVRGTDDPELAQHIATCPECQASLDTIRMLDDTRQLTGPLPSIPDRLATTLESLLPRIRPDLVTPSAPSLIERARERVSAIVARSEEHTSELQSRENLVCRLLLEKKK